MKFVELSTAFEIGQGLYHLTFITGPPITFHVAFFGVFCLFLCCFLLLVGVVWLFAGYLQWIVTAAGLCTGPIPVHCVIIPDGGIISITC